MPVLVRSRRTRVKLACLCVVAFSLTGCTSPDNFGAFALSIDGSRVLIATCLDRDITQINVHETRPTGFLRAERQAIWEATGDLAWDAGESVEVGAESPGLQNELVGEANPAPGVRYDISTENRAHPGYSAEFTIPSGGLREGVWLSPYGEQAEEPCDFTEGWWLD